MTVNVTANWTNLGRWIITPSSLGYDVGYALQCAVSSQSVASNYTTANYRLVGWIVEKASSRHAYDNNTRTLTYIQDGVKIKDGVGWKTGDYPGLYNYTESSPKTLLSWSGSFTHDTDGSYSKSYSVTCNPFGSTQTASGTMTFPTILRASQISNVTSGGIIESAHAVTFNQYLSGVTHNLTATVGSVVHTESGYTSGTQFSFTAAELASIYAANPSAATVTVMMELTTVGYGSSTGNVSDSIIDTLTLGTVSYADSNSTVTAITGNNKIIVQNQSTLSVTIAAASTTKGASIKAYDIYINGTLKQEVAAAGTVSVGTLDYTSNKALKVVATDTRGYTAEVTLTMTIQAWSTPTASVACSRVNNFEAQIQATISAVWSSGVTGNSLAITYGYKLSTDTQYTTGMTAIASGTQVTLGETFDNTKIYDIKFMVADAFDSSSYTAVISKGIPIMFVDAGMASVGFGGFPMKDNTVENWGVERWHGNLEAVNGSTTITLTMERLIALLSGLISGGWRGEYWDGHKVYTSYVTLTHTGTTAVTAAYDPIATPTRRWIDNANSYFAPSDGGPSRPLAYYAGTSIYLWSAVSDASVTVRSWTSGTSYVVVKYTID